MSDTNKRSDTAGGLWALCPDLLFASRIRATALTLGLPLVIARTPGQLLDAIAATAESGDGARVARGGLALVDLAAAPDAAAAIAALKQRFPRVEVVAFAPHVAADRIQAARDAGADRVLARSAFVTQLSAILGAAARAISAEPDRLS